MIAFFVSVPESVAGTVRVRYPTLEAANEEVRKLKLGGLKPLLEVSELDFPTRSAKRVAP